MIHIDQKMTVWERFSIEDEYKESLEAFLKESPDATSLEIYDWACDNGLDPHCETIEGTQELISTKENGGAPVLEIQQDNKLIYEK